MPLNQGSGKTIPEVELGWMDVPLAQPLNDANGAAGTRNIHRHPIEIKPFPQGVHWLETIAAMGHHQQFLEAACGDQQCLGLQQSL